MIPEHVLEVSALKVARGGAQALCLERLTLRKGEILALIGPNGAGKSTLLLCLAGLLTPDSGQIVFDGEPLKSGSDLAAFRRHVTLAFQETLLLDATVEENISIGLRFRGVKKSDRSKAASQCAERFGIGHLLKRNARELSGGEAQRTALARALVLKPEVLLLDEPFSSLDAPSRNALMRDLSKVLRESDCTVVMATHELTEALHVADTLAVLHAGRLVQHGPIMGVVNHPANGFVAAFVGMEVLITGIVKSCCNGSYIVETCGRHIVGVGDVEPGREITLGIRPENVTIALRSENESSARNQFPGRVSAVLTQGPFLKLELDCGFFLSAYVTVQAMESLHLREGKMVFASFKATSVHLM